MKHDYDPSLDLYVKAALGRKALGLVVLDVRDLTSVADAFMVKKKGSGFCSIMGT